MELYPLHVFLTIANEKSFSRAAEKLHRTQPAISLALQRLETELGERLIDRSAKDLVLTDAGRTVTPRRRKFDTAVIPCARNSKGAQVRPIAGLGREEAALVLDGRQSSRSEAFFAGEGSELQQYHGHARGTVRESS